MASGNSKLLLGLILGATIGGAAGWFMASGKKDELMNDLREVTHRIKDDVRDVFHKQKAA